MYKNIYTTIFPFLQKKNDAPAAETPATLEAQTNSALDSSSPRGGVLVTPGETVPQGTENLMPVDTSSGTLFVNQDKTGFESPQQTQNFVDRNGVAPLIGKAENIPNNSDARFALRTEDMQGNELATSAVTNEQSALEQANLDRQSFGSGVNQTLVPSDEVAQRRIRENETPAVGGIADEYSPIDDGNAPVLLPKSDLTPMRRTQNEDISGNGIRSDNAPLDSGNAPYIVNRSGKFNSTADELAYQLNRARNPQNEDKGVRGLLKEIAQNFLYSMAMAGQMGGNNPDWKQVLLGGGMGAGFGMLNRTWNEQRDAERRIPGLQNQVKQENDERDAEINRNYKIVQTQNIGADNETAKDKLRQSDERLFWQETAKYGYDPNNPTMTQKKFTDKYGQMPARAASNAKTVKVNGVTFERQADGSYREAGLPVEKRNKEEQFLVTDANGDTFTYWMTSENAGKTRSQLIAEGYKVEAANLNTKEGVDQYNNKLQRDYEKDIADQDAVITKNNPIIKQNNDEITRLNNIITNQSWSEGEKNTKEAQDKIDALKIKNAQMQGENDAATKEIERLKKTPPKLREFTPTQVVTGQTNNNPTTGNSVTTQELQQVFEANKSKMGWKSISDAENYYKSRGYTIQ